jgi:hypothetical protein
VRKNIILLLKKIHIYTAVFHARANFKAFIYQLFPESVGVSMYSKMQKAVYKKATTNQENIKDLCVGNFDDHEKYPYEKCLLEKFTGPKKYALDFGCGMGRMMRRMLAIFEHVDGADLEINNLNYATVYLNEENNLPKKSFDLFQTNGTGCDIKSSHKYNFIYSTICLQHISVYKIRHRIFSDLYHLLEDGGQCCFQLGFGWDNGIHWFDNIYGAKSTNGNCDVTIPNEKHLKAIELDFIKMGFKNISFTIKESPHTNSGLHYHTKWIYIHLVK